MTSETRLFNRQRRKFLEMVSKAGVSSALWRASPLVGGAMVNRYAEAADAPPKRLICLSYPAGAPRGTFLPQSLTEMNRSSEALLDVAEYCNFYLANIIGGGHGSASAALSTGGSGDSFDVQVAALIGANNPYRSLHLGVRCNTTRDLISQLRGQPIVPENNADALYQQLFGGPPPGGAAQKLYERQSSALSANTEALQVLMAKLGSEEKARMETHINAIERLDKRLNDASQFVPPEGCSNPTMASEGATDNGGGMVSELKMMADLGITAMRCGLTNVVSIQIDDSQSDWRYEGPSFSEAHHQTCHGRGTADLVTITKYVNSGVAYVVKALAETPDPAGGMMIDNTVFLQSTDQDGQSHTTDGCPNIVATKMQGMPSGTINTNERSNRDVMADIASGLGLDSQIAAGNMDDIRKNANIV